MLHQKSTPDEAIHHIEQMELLLLTNEEKQRLNQIMSLDYLLKDAAIHDLIAQDLKDKKWIKDTQVLIKTCYAKIEKNLIAQHHITECHNFIVFRFLEDKLMTCDIEVSKQIGSWIFNEINRRGDKTRWISQKFMRNFDKSNISQLFECQLSSPSLLLDLSWLNKHREMFFSDDIFLDLKKRVWSVIEHSEHTRQNLLRGMKKEVVPQEVIIESHPDEQALVQQVIENAQVTPTTQSVKDLILGLSFDPSETTTILKPAQEIEQTMIHTNESSQSLVEGVENKQDALQISDNQHESMPDFIVYDKEISSKIVQPIGRVVVKEQNLQVMIPTVSSNEEQADSPIVEEKKIPKFGLRKKTQPESNLSQTLDLEKQLPNEEVVEASLPAKEKLKFGAKKQELANETNIVDSEKKLRFGAVKKQGQEVKRPGAFGAQMCRNTNQEDGFSSHEELDSDET